jgi:hypothetical protein
MYLFAFNSTPFSIVSKLSSRLNAASAVTKMENPILIGDEELVTEEAKKEPPKA